MRVASWTPLGRRSLLATTELVVSVAITTALLVVVDGAWFRPLPFVRSHELVQVSPTRALERALTAAQSREMQEALAVDPRIAGATRVQPGNLSERYNYEPGGGTSLYNIAVSPEFFSVLGIVPPLGRAFTQADIGQPNLVPAVIGHTIWQSRWGGDRDVIGRVVQLGDTQVEIVGVMPPGFAFPDGATIWTPLVLSSFASLVPAGFASGQPLPSYVRLVAGFSAREFALAYPGLDVLAFEQLYRPEQPAAVTFLLAGSGVLLLCVILNLFSLRAVDLTRRLRDAGIRQSLGATPLQVLRETATRVATLATVALAGTWVAIPVLTTLVLWQLPPLMFRHLEVVYTWRTVAASFVLALAGALVYHWPASPGPRILADATAHRRGLWAHAMATALLVACGAALAYVAVLASASAARIADASPGFEPGEVISVSYRRRLTTGQAPAASLRDRYLDARDLLDVRAVALASGRPLQPTLLRGIARVAGNAACEPAEVPVSLVTPEYFQTLRIPIVEGELFGPSAQADTAGGSPSAARDASRTPLVVNEALMREWRACGATLGSRVQVMVHSGPIVAIARDTIDRDFRQPPEPRIYLPFQASPAVTPPTLLVRRGPSALGDAERALEDQLARMFPGYDVRRLSDELAEVHAADRGRALALQLFCGLSVLLAAVGLLANQTALLDSRRREMALRLALGADLPHLRRLIVVPAVGGAILGTPVGLLIGLACGRLGETLFVDVSAVYAPALVWVPVVSAAIAAGVSLFGARAVDRISPVSVLKEES